MRVLVKPIRCVWAVLSMTLFILVSCFSSNKESLPLSKLALIGPATLNTDTCSSEITVSLVNSEGAPAIGLGNTPISLSTEGRGLFYSDSACTENISSVIVPGGANTKVFYFMDATAENLTLTAQKAGLTSGTLDLSITSASNPGTVTISNLHNKQVVMTGFIVGSASSDVIRVGCRFDGGTVQDAVNTSNSNWYCKLPTTTNPWKQGSLHTIMVGDYSSGTLLGTTSIQVIKGNNHDINGDGYPDLAVGATYYSSRKGRIYIYLSRGRDGLSSAESQRLSDPGATNVDEFGYTVALGDVDGDGYADLMAGSYGYSNFRGRLYFYISNGPSGLPSTISSFISDPDSPGTNYFSSSIAVGDINGDGFADLLVGSGDYSTGQGIVRLFQSGSGLPLDGTVTSTLNSPNPANNNFFGNSLAIADITGDGFGDAVIGSPGYTGGSYKGRAYTYHFQSGALSTNPAQTFSDPTDTLNDRFGWAVSAGDINGDGCSDVVISSPGYSTYRGRNYGYHSQCGAGLPPSETLVLSDVGPTNGDWFGYAHVFGDFNLDGFMDFATSAYHYNGWSGRMALFNSRGWAGLPIVPDLNVNDPLATSLDEFGYSFGAADFNGDGYIDLAVGADGFATYPWISNEGAVHIFYSSANGVPSVSELTLHNPNGASTDYFGIAVTQ